MVVRSSIWRRSIVDITRSRANGGDQIIVVRLIDPRSCTTGCAIVHDWWNDHPGKTCPSATSYYLEAQVRSFEHDRRPCCDWFSDHPRHLRPVARSFYVFFRDSNFYQTYLQSCLGTAQNAIRIGLKTRFKKRVAFIPSVFPKRVIKTHFAIFNKVSFAVSSNLVCIVIIFQDCNIDLST